MSGIDYEKRASLWRSEALGLYEQVRRYEREHPDVAEGVPCFAKAEQAMEEALGKVPDYAVEQAQAAYDKACEAADDAWVTLLEARAKKEAL